MSYAIANIIYGIPVTTDLVEKIRDYILNNNIDSYPEAELEEAGFKLLYSAGGEQLTGYLGVSLGEISECDEPILISEICKIEPTFAQTPQVEDWIKELPEYMKKLVPKPSIYLVWSNS